MTLYSICKTKTNKVKSVALIFGTVQDKLNKIILKYLGCSLDENRSEGFESYEKS